MPSRTISHDNREVNLLAATDPSNAQFQLWLAQMKRDHGDISDREMNKTEIALKSEARKARTIMNPFTGEIRRIDEDGNLLFS